jgi:hypothetical protein
MLEARESPDSQDGGAEALARAFLGALDEERWRDAAALVARETQSRFRTFLVERITGRGSGSAGATDTHFASPADMIGVADASEAARTPAEELLARFAESSHPGNLHRLHPGIAGLDGGAIRITRTLLKIESRGPDRAVATYRTEWWHGRVRNEATAGDHTLELIRTDDGWHVHDADLSGRGGGHILPPPF